MKVVHYLNQFFAGVGGEEAASTPPAFRPEPLGPGRRLAALLPEGVQIVGTVFCGDDYVASRPEAIAEILALAAAGGAEGLVCGPAFTSGRYGLGCAWVGSAASREGLLTVISLHPDNPGLAEVDGAIALRSGATAREMGPSLETLAAAWSRIAKGQNVGRAEGRIGSLPRRSFTEARSAAERSVDLALRRFRQEPWQSEIALPSFDWVRPAPALPDPSGAVVALVTEGGLVPLGNPDRLESSRATKWLRYDVEGLEGLEPGQYVSVDGGFSTEWVDADPNRLVPLDAVRELEAVGGIGRLHEELFVTTGNGTSVDTARRCGIEIAAALRTAEVQAAILTAT